MCHVIQWLVASLALMQGGDVTTEQLARDAAAVQAGVESPWRCIREYPTGILVVNAFPIQPTPHWESVEKLLKAGGATAIVPNWKFLRLRALWISWDNPDPAILHSTDIGLTEPGLTPAPFRVFDAKFTNGLLVVIYCDQYTLRAEVYKPGVYSGSLLPPGGQTEVSPRGAYFNSPKVMTADEIKTHRPIRAIIDESLEHPKICLSVHSAQGKVIRFELHPDGQGFRWFRPKAD